VAAELAGADLATGEPQRQRQLRDRLEEQLRDAIPGRVALNGPSVHRLPNTLNVSVRGVMGHELLEATPAVAASVGSACHSGSHTPSPVLTEMGCDAAHARSAIRLSLGRWTTAPTSRMRPVCSQAPPNTSPPVGRRCWSVTCSPWRRLRPGESQGRRLSLTRSPRARLDRVAARGHVDRARSPGPHYSRASLCRSGPAPAAAPGRDTPLHGRPSRSACSGNGSPGADPESEIRQPALAPPRPASRMPAQVDASADSTGRPARAHSG
jgi:hypothetical protein